MKHLLQLTFFLCFLCVSQAQQQQSTYFFIRHAEKVNDSSKNPHLSAEGKERAKQWVNILKETTFDAIYSTDYFRTKETATPIAKANNLEITLYNPRAFDLQQFINNTKGKNVLIVGHSNTTPIYVNTLIGENKYGQIQESNYGNLYIITIKNDTVTDVLLCNL